MKRVIISTNDNPNYFFFLPLVVAAWKVLGFSVTCIVVSEKQSRELKKAITKAQKIDKDFKAYYIESPKFRTGSVAQISRLYGFLLSDNYDEYIITSDIDMIPMGDFFTKLDIEKCTFVGKDLTGGSQYPICYIGMKAIDWYAYMQVEYGTGFETALNEELERWTHQLKSEDFYTYWDIDQRISTRQANRLEKRSPEKFVNIDRGFEKGLAANRVDRAKFSWIPGVQYIDMHAEHGIQDDPEKLSRLKSCLYQCTEIDISWLDAYVKSLKKPAKKVSFWEKVFEPNQGNYDSHALLLLKALELTKNSKNPVVELGSGAGSTERLVSYCSHHKRTLLSFDNNQEWAKKMSSDIHKVQYVHRWNEMYKLLPEKISVLFVDHAPGERRVLDIEMLARRCEYLVIHNTETDGEGDYKYEKIWHLLEIIERFRVGGVGAEAVLARPVVG